MIASDDLALTTIGAVVRLMSLLIISCAVMIIIIVVFITTAVASTVVLPLQRYEDLRPQRSPHVIPLNP